MSPPLSHDHNFKNLILDYPRQALAFFAADEAADLDDSVVITPVRQEQLKERLGDRFHELDVPLLVEWPDGRREMLLFVLEEETRPARFSIHRLAHYCLSLSELFATSRVVPVVIFLQASNSVPGALLLGSERHCYMTFTYLACHLASLPVEQWLESDNLVARLNLPNMRRFPEQNVAVYAQAIRGLLQLEPNIDLQLKYLDFVDIYSGLDDNEREIYHACYAQESQSMTRLTERLRDEGMQQGMQKGLLSGERKVLARLLIRRFGSLDLDIEQRLAAANQHDLEQWADNILDAETLNDVFRD